MMERSLQRLGFQAEVARDGERGLQRAREINPAAIILDLELPGMDGFAVLKSLSTAEELREIPVFVTSVHSVRDQVLALGARAYLAKPIDRQVLKAALHANLPGHQHTNVEAGPHDLARTATG